MTTTRTLILGSTSPFRAELLQRLRLPFEQVAPDIDETPLPGEPPEQLVYRLSEQKARAVATHYPDALIIGSDQVSVIDGRIIGKPGNHEQAVRQLQNARNREVSFLTGLCLHDARNATSQCRVEPFKVHFRDLSDDQIEHYLQREQPWNCAGSFKSEGLGVALFDKLIGEDPSALMGLPLIRLTRMLESAGMPVL